MGAVQSTLAELTQLFFNPQFENFTRPHTPRIKYVDTALVQIFDTPSSFASPLIRGCGVELEKRVLILARSEILSTEGSPSVQESTTAEQLSRDAGSSAPSSPSPVTRMH